MNFSMTEAIELLERTPKTLTDLLTGVSHGWLTCNEGEGTWNVKEVIEHLIEAEKHNWIPRLAFILREGDRQAFPVFNRYSHLQNKTRFSIDELLGEFVKIREENIKKLVNMVQTDDHLEQVGFHPTFGTVKVRELIATWTVHDLSHISQIARVMANRYKEDVGSWREYLGILKK